MLVGTLTHEVLAEFVPGDSKEYSKKCLFKIFNGKWRQKRSLLLNEKHYNEIKEMLENWFEYVQRRAGNKLGEYFKGLKTEIKLKSDEYNVSGILDLVNDNKGHIVEYKTSSKDVIKPEYKLQLGIYALLFIEKFKKLPERLSIYFLKHGEKDVPVSSELLNEAKKVCKLIKLKTLSRDIKDYPCKKSPLCKWGGGECGFMGNALRKYIHHKVKLLYLYNIKFIYNLT